MALLHDAEFWVGVGFAVVIAILLWKRVPGLVGRMLDERAAAIGRELDEARRLREEAAKLLEGYVAKAGKAEEEAAAILGEARAEAERYAKEIRDQLRAQIERRAQMAKEKIAQAEATTLAELRALAADHAAAAAEKIITGRMNEQRAATLVQQSLKELPEKLN